MKITCDCGATFAEVVSEDSVQLRKVVMIDGTHPSARVVNLIDAMPVGQRIIFLRLLQERYGKDGRVGT